jgi:hypothetical protein
MFVFKGGARKKKKSYNSVSSFGKNSCLLHDIVSAIFWVLKYMTIRFFVMAHTVRPSREQYRKGFFYLILSMFITNEGWI